MKKIATFYTDLNIINIQIFHEIRQSINNGFNNLKQYDQLKIQLINLLKQQLDCFVDEDKNKIIKEHSVIIDYISNINPLELCVQVSLSLQYGYLSKLQDYLLFNKYKIYLMNK